MMKIKKEARKRRMHINNFWKFLLVIRKTVVTQLQDNYSSNTRRHYLSSKRVNGCLGDSFSSVGAQTGETNSL